MLLQVSVLTDQVEAQGEKIRDLEFTKEELQIKLEDAEQLLGKVSVVTIRSAILREVFKEILINLIITVYFIPFCNESYCHYSNVAFP